MSRTKSFSEYLEKRLDKEEIAEIEKLAALEHTALEELQHNIASVFTQYMADKGIGFNEIVRRLQISPTQANKILKGEANLTLNSIAHVAALIDKQPKIIFEEKNISQN